jgi:hypothetical protein
VRPRPVLQQPKVEMATEPAISMEIDIPLRDAEGTEPQSSIAVEEISAAQEPSIVETTAAEEEFAVENVENNVHLDLEFAMPDGANTEMEVIAESRLSLAAPKAIGELQTDIAAQLIVHSEVPVQPDLLAEPQDIPRTLGFRWNAFLQVLANGWSWLYRRLKTQQAKKRLRVCESVSLGEKRFIAVVQVDGEQFLVGGSSSSVSTLAHLEQPREFSDVFRRCEQSGMQA